MYTFVTLVMINFVIDDGLLLFFPATCTISNVVFCVLLRTFSSLEQSVLVVNSFIALSAVIIALGAFRFRSQLFAFLI